MILALVLRSNYDDLRQHGSSLSSAPASQFISWRNSYKIMYKPLEFEGFSRFIWQD